MTAGFIAELKRRNVIRAGVFYLAAAWLIAQVATQILPLFDVPSSWLRRVIVALAIGFPFWLAFAWFYEFTPHGLKRESDVAPADSITARTGAKMDRWIIATLLLAVVLLLANTFVWKKGSGRADALRTPEKSIAVLPFVNMSSDKEQEYFSDGISEELLNLLAGIPSLQVTARTSSFSFKGKKLPIPEIAKMLHVAHILEGSVRKAGDQVRITAQLIDAANDRHLWSQTYDRKLDDVFKIQDEIGADVVRALKLTLLGAAPKVYTTTPEAYALYLRGNEVVRPLTPEALDAGAALYRQALAIDPKYAPAMDGLTRAAINKAAVSAASEEKELWPEARRLAEQEVAMYPDYPPAHGKLGSVALFCCNDVAGAIRHYQDALALDSRDPTVLVNSANAMVKLGRFDQAIAVYEADLRRDPINVNRLSNLAYFYQVAGRYDESIRTFLTVLELAPTRYGARAGLATSQLLGGDPRAALAQYELEKDEGTRLFDLSLAFHALGRKADSDAALAALTAKYEAEYSYQIAEAHAFRGETEDAFAWLDRAVERKDPGLREILETRLFDRIRSDPRWLPFVRKLGKAPEQLAQFKFEVPVPPTIDDAAAVAEQAAKP